MKENPRRGFLIWLANANSVDLQAATEDIQRLALAVMSLLAVVYVFMDLDADGLVVALPEPVPLLPHPVASPPREPRL